MHNFNRHSYIYVLIQLLFFEVLSGFIAKNYYYDVTESKSLQPSQIMKTLSAHSQLECCFICGLTEYCASGSYDLTSNTCLLSTLTSAGMTTYLDEDTSWISFSRDEWFLIFRAPKDIGGDMYQSYVNGSDVTDHVSCLNLTSTACNQNYRHPIVDFWSSAGFKKVRVSFYKNNVQDAYIDFNATGSTMMTWFRKERILETSWTNAATESYNVFSIEGWEARRFYISLNHGGCYVDRIYSIVVTAHVWACEYDNHTSFPQFIYANGTGSAALETGIGINFADFMAIFVK